MEVQQNDVVENQTVPVLVLTDTGIQRVAFWLRILGGGNRHSQFDPIHVMERVIAPQDDTFNYYVIEKKDWIYGSSCEARYYPVENTIYIRGDVYEAAQLGNFPALVTIAHEVSHYIQNLLLRLFSYIPGLTYKTEECAQDSIQMQAHENQTDSITVLLFTEDLFLGKTDDEVIATYIIAPIGEVVCVLIEKLGEWIANKLQTYSCTRKKEVDRCAV